MAFYCVNFRNYGNCQAYKQPKADSQTLFPLYLSVILIPQNYSLIVNKIDPIKNSENALNTTAMFARANGMLFNGQNGEESDFIFKLIGYFLVCTECVVTNFTYFNDIGIN